jgi:DNA segregation ATPase FtsK/SpoIIIE-like protein
MPHALIAGVTGAGKSNSVTASLAHLLTVRTPNDVQVMLIDPKQVDLTAFANLPHTIKHVTQADSAVAALESLVSEMHKRNSMFAAAGVKNLASYQAKGNTLPAIVCVVDELGLLMDSHNKVLEPVLLALLQTARASGIHLVIGTQRPDNDILRPRLRANLPVRVCFAIGDANSSRLILNDDSAAGLLGQGDGLFKDNSGTIKRFQSPFIDDKTLAKAVKAASTYAASSWTLEGLQGASESLPDFSKMSQLEGAMSLCERLEEIRSQDLVDVGICDSQAVGKKLIKQLRDQGIVGAYNPSRKSSPVVIPVSQHDGYDVPATDRVAGKQASTTQHDGYSGLKNLQPRVVN